MYYYPYLVGYKMQTHYRKQTEYASNKEKERYGKMQTTKIYRDTNIADDMHLQKKTLTYKNHGTYS